MKRKARTMKFEFRSVAPSALANEEEREELYDKLAVFTGNAHPELAQDICRYLNVPLGRAEVFEFSNENIFVKIIDVVRQQDVFIIQPGTTPVSKSVMELLIMIDAMKRASAGRITAVLPYYAYSRSDRKDQPRVPITARLMADLITVAGANRVLTLDLHAGQIQGFFSIPVDELTAMYTISRYIKGLSLDDAVIVAADEGITKRARNFAERLHLPLAIVEKRRIGTDRVEALNIIGEVEGKRAIIIDDEIDTAGSLTQATKALESRGVIEVYACATHGVFSGPAIQRIAESSLKEVAVTNTVPLPKSKQIAKIKVLPIADLIGEAIRRIHIGASIGAMYEE